MLVVIIGFYFDFENGFASLDAVAAFQMCGFDADSVDESSVRRAEIAEENLRRSDFENAVMTRKKTILRQTKMRVLASSDKKGIVLLKCKYASRLRSRNNAQSDNHLLFISSKIYFAILPIIYRMI